MYTRIEGELDERSSHFKNTDDKENISDTMGLPQHERKNIALKFYLRY